MGSVTVKDTAGDLITLHFSSLQEGSWIREPDLIEVWMNDQSYHLLNMIFLMKNHGKWYFKQQELKRLNFF